jgi:hypothetical protein
MWQSAAAGSGARSGGRRCGDCLRVDVEGGNSVFWNNHCWARKEREIGCRYEFFLIHRLPHYIRRLTNEYNITYACRLTNKCTGPMFVDLRYSLQFRYQGI